jgi:hypothetical protein
VAAPQAWQNFEVALNGAPHLAQPAAPSAVPQLLQNLPLALMPHLGHFIWAPVMAVERAQSKREHGST